MWKRLMLSLMLVAGSATVMVDFAEARRIGGGRSFGMQRSTTPPARQATPPSAAPQQATPAARPATAQAQPPAQSGWRRFAGPLAGLAAGIGLAALLSHFGIGAEFAGIILAVLAAVVVFALIRRLMGGSRQAQPAYAGAGSRNSANAFERSQYGAEAQPARFETFQQQGGASVDDRFPAGFDAEGFARQAKVNFIRLQAANDNCNLEDIREFTSPEMFAEIKLAIDERGCTVQKTDVVVLNAEVLEVAEENRRYIASVRYHGMVREESGASPEAFDEIWHLTKPVEGNGGWVLSGIQQAA
ncbi:Tim44 domain-containing protein [Uliginosibacterium sp. sgz301328]|uniref:Tim44 domain-containing protein n=1 Tax=Uliginosibacterium sp. sgz301328 TaxID=3243764 RepID=UPI00359CD2BF